MEPMTAESMGRIDAFSFVYNGKFYVGSGLTEQQSTLCPWYRFDFSSAKWSIQLHMNLGYEEEETHHWKEGPETGICCAVLGNCAYMFGGFWEYGYAVHEFSLEGSGWRKLEPQNREDGPMNKFRAGMIACGDESLCVFGGYGEDLGQHVHQPGATYHYSTHFPKSCWNNELHVFNVRKGTWSSPETTGPRPPPCASFTFTKVDLSRAVLFGGTQRHRRVNEVHILDFDCWHWSGAILPTSPGDLWPQGRSLHSACALVDPTFVGKSLKNTPHCSGPTERSSAQLQPKLFVLWGANTNEKPATDAWILDVNSLTWSRVKLPPSLDEPRVLVSLGCHNRSPSEAELVVYGGQHSMDEYSLWTDYRTLTGTTLLHFGVKSLYYSCVDYIAEQIEFDDSSLKRLLPPRIQNDISQERDKRANIVRYKVQVAH